MHMNIYMKRWSMNTNMNMTSTTSTHTTQNGMAALNIAIITPTWLSDTVTRTTRTYTTGTLTE